MIEWARAVINRLPGGSWLLGWTDPLHIARRLLQKAVQERAHYARGWLLDLGCGEQPHRHLFDQVERYFGMDLPPNGRVDFYGDGIELPVRDEAFHTVLCNQVLEHIPEPKKFMEEVVRVLRPGGVLLLTTSQTWGLHLEPHDFYRYTEYGLRYLAKESGLAVVDLVPTSGLWATLTQRVADTVVNTYCAGRSRWVIVVLSLLLAPVLVMGYGLDRLCGKRGDTLDHVMVAKKTADS